MDKPLEEMSGNWGGFIFESGEGQNKNNNKRIVPPPLDQY